MQVDFGAFFEQSKKKQTVKAKEATKEIESEKKEKKKVVSSDRITPPDDLSAEPDEPNEPNEPNEEVFTIKRRAPKRARKLAFTGPSQSKDEAALKKEIAHVWKLLNAKEEQRQRLKQADNENESKEEGENQEEEDDDDDLIDPTEVEYEPNKVVVNISGKFNELDIKNAFEAKCGGKIKSVLILRNKKGSSCKPNAEEQEHKTTAFVEFFSNSYCQKAVALNGGKINGAKVGVALVRKKFANVKPGIAFSHFLIFSF